MEEQSSPMFDLQIDDSAQTYLRDTTKWTRFIAITFYVCMGLMVFFLGIMFMFKDRVSQALSEYPRLSELGTSPGMMLTVLGLVIVICLVVFAIVTYALMRFSTQTRKGIEKQDPIAFESGIGSLKNYMIMTGVMSILSLLIGLLQLIAIFKK